MKNTLFSFLIVILVSCGSSPTNTTATFNTIDMNTKLLTKSQSLTFNTKCNKKIILNVTNPTSNNLKYTIVKYPSHGTLFGTAPNLIYKTDKKFHGSDSFSYKIDNGITNSDITNVYLNIKRYVKVLEVLDIHNNGIIDNVRHYTYDEFGNIKTNSWDHDNNGIIDNIYTYTYDDHGNILTDELDWDNDGIIDVGYSYTYTYDQYGNILTLKKEDYFYKTNNSYTEFSYVYDSKGNILESVANTGGIRHYYIYYTYDTKGNVLEEKAQDGKTYEYTYDENNNITSEIWYYTNSSTIKGSIKYEYNSDGNILRKTTTNSNEENAIYINKYTYDNKCNVSKIHEEIHQSWTDVYVRTYSWDKLK